MKKSFLILITILLVSWHFSIAAGQADPYVLLHAKLGDAVAQNTLGGMYYSGQGVPQNDKEAAKWFHLAADQGNPNAQGNLGVMYLTGRGVPESYVNAYVWFALAAANGNEVAQGEMEKIKKLLTPTQIEQGQEKAEKLWNKLNNQGQN